LLDLHYRFSITMSSRDAILTAVRRHLPQSSPLPDLDGSWITYADPIAQFATVLESTGGRCVRVASLGDINAELESFAPFAAAKRVASLVADVGRNDVDLAAVADPHELKSVDFAILPGVLGVAENAAVWVTDEGLPHRVLYFLCEHLALVIRADQIVHNLYEAYQRIGFEGRGFGAFIAGPSKTADIEQSLVIGAHGPKSTTVFVVG
jgi:L-lactate dehydrogenase complex protein LldG